MDYSSFSKFIGGNLLWQEDMADLVAAELVAGLSGLSLSLYYYYVSVVVAMMTVAVLALAN